MALQAETEVGLPPRYQVREVLKQSPSTCVYRVFDIADERDEAIKILRHEFSDPRDVLQFKSEFSALAALEHPGIVHVYDYGLLHNRYPYFTMEYFHGRRISEYFDGKDWNSLYEVILQIASALHHVHDAGLLHLDLKPSNILVDQTGRVKLMDFGLSAESSQVLDRRVRGTLHYMAPEVLRQDRIDARADLYALGMTLYETVTGALPTWGKPPIEIIRFHLDGEIRRPSLINPQVPDRLEKIILRLLEKDPRHRYPSAIAVLQDVALLTGSRYDPSRAVSAGTLLAAPLVGREQESKQIADAIHSARESQGSGILILGGEGMGKSRLVREATLRAQLDGARVFTGRCPVARRSIYAPFFEIFRQMLREVNADADPSDEISRMLRPIIADEGGGKPSKSQKFRLFNRISQSIQDMHGFLTAVGVGGSPLVLVVEDLQWADPATAELLLFLIGEAKRTNLVVIGTATTDTRTGTAEDHARETPWEERAKEAGIATIKLEPLSEPNVAEYIASLLGPSPLPHEFVRWIVWESGGSPVHIRRVIEYLIAHEYLHHRETGWYAEMDRILELRVPGGAAALWNERLEALDPEDRRLLETVAVLGQEVDITLMTAVVELRDEETYSRLRHLAALGLLDEGPEEGSFRFPQLALRELVYDSTRENVRVATHRRAASVLERMLSQGASELLGQTAFHYARANENAPAIEYSIRAGDVAASSLAHEQAAEFYRVALELIDLSGDDARKTEVREKLGDAYYRAGNLRGAMQVYQFLLRSLQSRSRDAEGSLRCAAIMKKIAKLLSRRGEHDRALSFFQDALAVYNRYGTSLDRAEALSRIAWLHREQGDLVEAEPAARQALDLVSEGEPRAAHGFIKNTLALIAFARGNWDEARSLFREAIEIAERVGSSPLSKVAASNYASLLVRTGEWQEALDHYRRAMEQSEAEGDLWDLVTTYEQVGRLEMGRGNFHAAADLFLRSVTLDEKLGGEPRETYARTSLGEALEMIGRWREAKERYEVCMATETASEARSASARACLGMGRLTSRTGDLAEALAYVQRAHDHAERTRDEELIAEASLVLAHIERDRENVPDSFRHGERALELFERSSSPRGVASARTLVADLHLRTQNYDTAQQECERATAAAEALGDRFTIALNEWTGAKLSFATGKRELAEQAFERALAVFEELDTPFEEGRALFDLGVLRDEPEEATNAIRKAIRIFERLEATHDLDRARGALFRIRPGGRPVDSNVIGLYEVVKVVNSTLNLDEVLNRVLDLALRRLRAERGMLILLDPITSEMRTTLVRNIREGAEADPKRSPQAIIREVIQGGRSIISADARADDRFIDSDSVISDNIVSTLCVPLVIKERIAGAIYVDHRQTRHLFSQRDLHFLEAFADQAAIAIENARLYEELDNAKVRLSLENETLRKEVLVEKHLDSVVGHSEAVARIQMTIRKAAASSSTVFLRGESGSGKGLVARIIHNVGPRRNGPFIKFNCAALPESLAESELFGHEKGAFTGADRRKLGRFELAHGGTIFLDEIGRISLAMQAKLLRVVEDKEFERVGGTATIKTDVKIIAAAQMDVEKMIVDGTFREDLFYRLNIIPLHLPPLRQRREDIPPLAEHFIRKICRDLGMEPKRLEPGIIDIFMSYHWPGNIRELEATLHRAIVMSSGDTLTRADFLSLFGGDASTTSAYASEALPTVLPDDVLNPLVRRMTMDAALYDEVISKVDRQLIRQALSEAGGKIRETARRLGLARNTLKAKMQKYHIVAEE